MWREGGRRCGREGGRGCGGKGVGICAIDLKLVVEIWGCSQQGHIYHTSISNYITDYRPQILVLSRSPPPSLTTLFNVAS